MCNRSKLPLAHLLQYCVDGSVLSPGVILAMVETAEEQLKNVQ